jgi:hypothetical protein
MTIARIEEIVTKHPTIVPILRKVNDATQQPSVQATLLAGFKSSEISEGQCHKDDFVNTLFDVVRGVKPAELMQLVNAFGEEYGDNVCYSDFLALVDKHGTNLRGSRNIQSAEKVSIKDGLNFEHR